MKVVNLFAGPGAGKSTTAAGVFHHLKLAGVNAELVGEFAKDLTWEKRDGALRNQLYVLGKQYQRIERLRGQVDIAVVDSPLLLSLIYCRHAMPEPFGPVRDLRTSIEAAAMAAYQTFDNVNFLVERVKPYNSKGRNQDEQGARNLDVETRLMLNEHHIPHFRVIGDASAAKQIVMALGYCA